MKRRSTAMADDMADLEDHKSSVHYEWEIRDFWSLASKVESADFKVDLNVWRLLCFPKQNAQPHSYISVFLKLVNAASRPAPAVRFLLRIKNHKDSDKDFRKEASNTFTPDSVDWGFSQMLPLKDVSVDSGYLRSDGSLVITVDIIMARRRTARTLGDDLLSLLEQPDGTSDLTLKAGDRSFAVHRAILAARCPYFKTLFASGFSDSAAKEHELPDANPDALELLLRAMYGGTLGPCSQELLLPAVELAGRLLLADVEMELGDRLVSSVTAQTVVPSVLWAAQRGDDALLARLEAALMRDPNAVSDDDLALLAERNPRLMARLFKAKAPSQSLASSS